MSSSKKAAPLRKDSKGNKRGNKAGKTSKKTGAKATESKGSRKQRRPTTATKPKASKANKAKVCQNPKQGNARFVKNQQYRKQRQEQAEKKQQPCRVVVCCSDSRVPPEIVLDDLRLGDLFVVRTAGHTLCGVALESIRYALEHLNVSEIVVLGHDSCGAVTAVHDWVARRGGDRDGKSCADFAFPFLCGAIQDSVVQGDVPRSIERHVRRTVRMLKKEKNETHKGTQVSGAIYELTSGRVRWL